MSSMLHGGKPEMAKGWLPWLWALALSGIVVLTGCSQSGPVVEFVEGQVLLDGAPLADAAIGFSPADGAGLGAFGRTDSAGKYRLTTAQGGKQLGGAPVGNYLVTVRKYRDRLKELGPRPRTGDAAAETKWDAEAKRLGELPSESLIPSFYGDKATSDLKVGVKKGRNVGPEFRFELKSDLKGG